MGFRTALRAIPDPCLVMDRTADADKFTEAVGVFKIGRTFKSSQYRRFPKTLKLLTITEFPGPPVVLDVAASDGSASLSVIESLSFSRYYLTDRTLEVVARRSRRGTLFLSEYGEPIFHVGSWLVAYRDVDSAIWPLRLVSRGIVAKSQRNLCGKPVSVKLINPRIRALTDPRVRIERYDVTTRWPSERVDLVIAANLFNRNYFPDTKIKAGLCNLRDALKDGGVLAVIENRAEEQATLFRLRGRRFVVETEVGSGSDICQLVRDL